MRAVVGPGARGGVGGMSGPVRCRSGSGQFGGGWRRENKAAGNTAREEKEEGPAASGPRGRN
eukprot:12499256-Heterocapsa_arctica.AAC.1